MVAGRLQPELGDDPVDTVAVAPAVGEAEQLEVLGYGEVGEEVDVVEPDRHRLPDVGVGLVQDPAVEAHLTVVGALGAGHAAQQGRLAAAVRAHQHRDPAGLEVEVDGVQHDPVRRSGGSAHVPRAEP